jgi:hypothetical protein
MELPSDQPTPPRDLVLKIWEDELKSRETLFNINGVSYKESHSGGHRREACDARRGGRAVQTIYDG